MAWYHRSRERLQRTPDGKLAAAPTKEQQATKLAEAEEFKPAPLAISENLPVPVDPKTGKPKPEQQAPVPASSPSMPAPALQAKPAAVPQATSTQSISKPAAKPKTLWASLLDWKKPEEELEEDLAADAEKEKKAEAKPAPKKYYDQPQPEKKPEEKPKQEAAVADKFQPAPIAMSTNPPAPANKPVSSTSTQTGIVPGIFQALKKKEKPEDDLEKDLEEELKLKRENEVKAAQEAEAAKAKETKKQKDEAEAKKAKEAEKNKPIDTTKLPQNEKPTFEQYQANPSMYGKAPGVSSQYKPTSSDLAKQPFQPYKASCTGWGYKAAENCKNCRAMDNMVHCPCGCGSYVPIDRGYDPFAGQESPEFKGGKPGSTRPW